MDMSNKDIKNHFEQAKEILDLFSTEQNMQKISDAIEMLTVSLSQGGKVISCGNGGSMCDAMHFAEELSGRFRNDRRGLAALSISDPSHISCVANDYGYEYVFSRFVESVGKKDDVLLGISTSGNSENVIEAVKTAKEKDIKTIVLTGKTGGQLADLADLEIRAPQSEYADRAQEIHIKVIHALIDGIERSLKLV